MNDKMTMTAPLAVKYARQWREETIRELEYLISDLQRDLDRLTTARDKGDEGQDGYTPQQGNNGYYLSQHCLRYEQALKASVKMAQFAQLADWID